MIKNMLLAAGLSVLPLASALAAPESAADSATAPDVAALRQSYRVAMQQYRTALQANPKDAVSHNLLGTCHQRLGDQKAASKEYKRAIKLAPQYAQAYNNLATVYHARGKFRRAVDYYRAAIERNPGLAAAHRNLGTALLTLGQEKEGVAAFAEAQRLDPTVLDASSDVAVGVQGLSIPQQYFLFAKIAARAGQVDTALDFLRKARAAGFTDFGKVRGDQDFRSVVPDQRFAALAN